MTDMTDTTDMGATYETRADLLGKIPVTFFMISGTLRLAGGRLSFTRSRDRVVFDAPIGEFHSAAPNATGFMIWHGATRYRFVIGQHYNALTSSSNPAIAVMGLPGAMDNVRSAQAGSARWVSELRPLCGPVPAGVEVATPWPLWKAVTIILGGTLLIGGAVIAIVVAAAS